MAKFQKISENSRKGIEEALVIAIVESFRKEKTIREDGTELYRYEVVLKNINFVNVMSDEELKEVEEYYSLFSHQIYKTLPFYRKICFKFILGYL